MLKIFTVIKKPFLEDLYRILIFSGVSKIRRSLVDWGLSSGNHFLKIRPYNMSSLLPRQEIREEKLVKKVLTSETVK